MGNLRRRGRTRPCLDSDRSDADRGPSPGWRKEGAITATQGGPEGERSRRRASWDEQVLAINDHIARAPVAGRPDAAGWRPRNAGDCSAGGVGSRQDSLEIRPRRAQHLPYQRYGEAVAVEHRG